MLRRSVPIAIAAALAASGCGSSHPPSHGAVAQPAIGAAARPDRSAAARAALLRAGADVMAYGHAHHSFDVGGVGGLHRLDPATSIVNFVDGRRTSFFLAVGPPTTAAIWRYDFDHNAISRAVCQPGPGRRCIGFRRW